MGRRSRNRITAPVSAAARPSPGMAAAGSPASRRSRRAPVGEAPKAPWSPFPLVELSVLLAILLIILGLLADGGRRGALLAGGIGLASLAGVELSVREHFAGYRSHSAVLAGAAAALVAAPLALFTELPPLASVVVAALVYAIAFAALRKAFQARSGGMGFRA
ncbi:MAG: hypothetical protein QOH46_3159 [Solirubrobacteraceae bacterium]|jgi:hypothetical protein|nr:hypothetical protein [Solirubrobacteraceae bacterium]